MYFSTVNTTLLTKDDMSDKLQKLKSKTKIKFIELHKITYDEKRYRRRSNTFHFEEDPFSKEAKGIGYILKDVIKIENFFQTNPQVRYRK